MNDKIELNIRFNTDDDGFLSQECPACQKRFKTKFGEGSDLPISFCPYCGHQGQGCWWTKGQADYIADIASKSVVEPELERMARDFNRNTGSGSPISMSMEVKGSPQPTPPHEPEEDWPIVLFDCCGEKTKHDGSHPPIHCIICGKTKPIKAD